MATVLRSDCPLNLSVELIGDRWTLLILRDMIFRDRRGFRDLLTNSDEGIASNVLNARLHALVAAGIVTRRKHAGHKQRIVYSLTAKGVKLLPVMIQLGAWGADNAQSHSPTALWFRVAAAAGPDLWDRMMSELQVRHSSTEAADAAAEPAFAGLAMKVAAATRPTVDADPS
ncbi:winged helix-turn-helix transcriptional regulator [Rhodococcus sp. 077-4]|uniref:winged helix-turn-helix transcriptional regulator n=1 Tax=Rhodococcus sp. 077-4 TaxID=2789271 RepID=UPI0039F59CEF